MPCTIAIEGNISAGKTTLLNCVRGANLGNIFPEPLEKWRNIAETSLLGLMYEDPFRWCYTFQSYSLLTRLKIHEKVIAQKADFNFLERSIYSDNKIFVTSALQHKYINTVEKYIYNEYFNEAQKWINTTINGIIYLRTDVNVCMERLKLRNRAEEQTITSDYLDILHNIHEQWLLSETELPVLVLDGNNNFKTDLDAKVSVINSIQQFCDSL